MVQVFTSNKGSEAASRTAARRTTGGTLVALSLTAIAASTGWFALQQQQQAVAAINAANKAKEAADLATHLAFEAAESVKKERIIADQLLAEAQVILHP